MKRTHTLVAGLVLAAVIGDSSLARAELPLIRLDRVFPLGGQAGSEVVVEIQGKDLDEVMALHFDRAGFKADLVKPNQFRVTIAADVTPGVYDVRAVGKHGISAGRLFEVGSGMTEVLEVEPNDTPDKSQPAPLNAAINGYCDGNGDDYYRFPARKGQRVLIECRGFRLDSTLRAVLTLAQPSGKVVAQSKPYYNRADPLLDGVIPDDGDYLVNLHDATYSGGLAYRLIVSDRPQIENAFPNAVVPGETAELTIVGRNLPGGKHAKDLEVLGLPLDQVTVPFSAPADPALALGFSQITPLPSASLAARGIQVWPKGFEMAIDPLTLVLAPDPVTREHEPNDTGEKGQEIALPTVLCGRLDKQGDADWYRFKAKRGDQVAIDLFCERIDAPGDPHVIVTNDKGVEIANVDDHGIRFNSLDMFNRDPQGIVNIPEDGTYRLLVQDTYQSGGPRFLYALRVGKPVPDFFPVVFHETPSDPTCPVVHQGGSAFVDFCLNRCGGFNGPATVEAEGLPPGVSCPPVHVSAQSPFASIVFTASNEAPEWSGAVRLKAWAMIDGRRVERAVRCSQRRWAIANISTSRACREICLAVRSKAPYSLKAPVPPQTVVAGESFEARMSVERLWPDFKGKVQLNGLNLPPGFGFATTEIAPDKTDATVKLTVASNVPPGTYTVILRGDAQVPFSPDPKAANKPNIRVADPSTPMTVEVKEPPKKP